MSTERTIHLHTVAFDEDTLTVTFMVDPGGLRGGIFLTQQMTLDRQQGYKETIDKLEKKMATLVLTALEEWEVAEPQVLTRSEPTERDDDDDMGMGFDPDEDH